MKKKTKSLSSVLETMTGNIMNHLNSAHEFLRDCFEYFSTDKISNIQDMNALFETLNDLEKKGLQINMQDIDDIALKANVPIIPVAFDYSKKEVRIGNPFHATGNYEVDMKLILHHFETVKGKFPERQFQV